MLLLPITAPGLTGALDAIALAITLIVVWHRNRLGAGIFCLLMVVQPLFFSQAANGGDLYVITFALIIVALWLERFAERPSIIALLGLFAGFVATSRVPILLFLCVFALGLYRQNKKSGLVFAATMIPVALALHFVFAAWSHQHGHPYPPLYVFRRASNDAGFLSKAGAVLLAGAALVWIFFRMSKRVGDWLLGSWLLMSALFIPEALKELAALHYDLRWEGSNYITFPIPLLLAVLAIQADSTDGSTPSPGNSCIAAEQMRFN